MNPEEPKIFGDFLDTFHTGVQILRKTLRMGTASTMMLVSALCGNFVRTCEEVISPAMEVYSSIVANNPSAIKASPILAAPIKKTTDESDNRHWLDDSQFQELSNSTEIEGKKKKDEYEADLDRPEQAGISA